MSTTASPTRWWHTDEQTGKVVCTLCPRECHIPEGKRGFCFVRANVAGELVLTTWGRSSGFCIDPIEKKPLNHFLPGTPVLSLGTAGCNLGCKFCQNWDISKSREMDTLAGSATPDAIVEAAKRTGCRSIAFTYNDPTIWAEYAIDIAKVARAEGVKTVAVTAGYINPEARREFYQYMDAANVDLKAFTETFYRKLTQTHLEPVLDTLKYLRHETDVWFELTNLMIPGENDSPDETAAMCEWIVRELGVDVPIHFTAFHPDFKMMDTPRTPHETLLRAREQALAAGIRYAYVGNVNDAVNQSTYCHHCGTRVIERDWYDLGAYQLEGNRCGHCGGVVPGVFEHGHGDWGRKRVPINISQTAPQQVTVSSRPAHSRRGTNRGGSQRKDGQVSAGSKPTTAVSTVATAPAVPPIQPRIDFDEHEVRAMLAYTRELVCATVQRREIKGILPPELDKAPAFGVFVSLSRHGILRACRGRWGGKLNTLGALLAATARDAATLDPRFATIHAGELGAMAVEVSLMHDPCMIEQQGEERVDHVRVGEHGLVIAHPKGRGLLLPQVATNAGWDAKTFLDRVCAKAGLPGDTWRRDGQAQVMTFRARVERLDPPQPELDPLELNSTRLHRYLDAMNLMLRDEPLTGVLAPGHDSVLDATHAEELGLYLQTESGLTAATIRPNHSLNSLAEVAVQSLKNLCARRKVERDPITRLTVLWQPITLTATDYPQRHQLLSRHAVLVRDRGRWSLVIPGRQGAGDKVGEALRSIGLTAQQWAQPAADHQPRLTAFNTIVFEARQRPSGLKVRHPARAGQFYPGDAAAMSEAIETHLRAAGECERRKHRAIMLPHAGWRFCGDIIGKVLARTEVPDSAIILGPRHTPHGARFSVAPHQRWDIPGGSVIIDTAIVHRLTQLVPDLVAEPAAHRMEHGSEVLVPFLERLNPNVRIVPIVQGMCDYDTTTAWAQALATLIRELPAPPLLVISSDMNHYAPEPENRRLDQLAVNAMATGNPRQLYETCRDQDISMCGVLPAVTIMQTLIMLNGQLRVQPIAYTNSAAVTGDSSQVVGYAGIVLD